MTKPIMIKERLAPFSHAYGTLSLIPGTQYAVEIYPALIRVYDLSRSDKLLVKEVTLPLIGPLFPFTVQQDLEKGCIKVFGNQGNKRFFFIPFAQV